MRRLAMLGFVVLATSCTADEVASPDIGCGQDLPNVAFEQVASASNSLEESPPGLAVDGDVGTAWSAGPGDSDEWIEIDLGETRMVTCVRLLAGDTGAGGTHRVNGGAHVNPGRELGTVDSASPGRWIELEGEWEFRFLRVTTLVLSGPPSWSEIEVR